MSVGSKLHKYIYFLNFKVIIKNYRTNVQCICTTSRSMFYCFVRHIRVAFIRLTVKQKTRNQSCFFFKNVVQNILVPLFRANT